MGEREPVLIDPFSLFQIFDLITLISTTILHRQLFSITYPIDSVVDNGVMSFLCQRLPLLLAALDLYEDAGFLTIMYNWNQMLLNAPTHLKVSRPFVTRLSFVTKTKLGLTYLLLGLQMSGLVQYLIDGKWKKKEVESAAESVTSESAKLGSGKTPLKNRKKGGK